MVTWADVLFSFACLCNSYDVIYVLDCCYLRLRVLCPQGYHFLYILFRIYSFYFMHSINLSGYLAASVQIKPVEPVEQNVTIAGKTKQIFVTCCCDL